MLNAGDLDTAFGINGAAMEAFGQQNVSFEAVAVQTDGKIVAAGQTGYQGLSQPRIVVARFNEDGTLDPSFNGTGFDLTEFNGSSTSVAIRANGQILVSGRQPNSSPFVARLHADGTVDTSFGSKGIVVGGGLGAFDLVGGGIYSLDGGPIYRYTPNGDLDSTFGSEGFISVSGANEVADNLAMQSDGTLLVVGEPSEMSSQAPNRIIVSRFSANGQGDDSFGDEGLAVIDAPVAPEAVNGLQPQIFPIADGKIVIALQGVTQSGPTAPFRTAVEVAELNSDGSIDSTFGDDGWAITGHFSTPIKKKDNLPEGVAVQADGKIVIAGQSASQQVGVMRLNADGSQDYTFSVDGRTTNAIGESASAVAIGKDGQIIVAGTADLTPNSPVSSSEGFVAEFDSAGGENLPAARSDQGELGITGTSGNDTIDVSAVGGDLKVVMNGTTSYFIASHLKSIFIHGGDGDDDISVSASVAPLPTTILGEGGDDSIISESPATIDGDAGNDHLIVTDGGSVSGGDGNDHLFAQMAGAMLDGGNGNDVEYGDIGNDTIYGDDGNDHLYGGDGDDHLYGGSGHDRLDGGSGPDRLNGGSGPDTLQGDGGNDVLYARDSSTDFLYGGTGNDSAQIDSLDRLESPMTILE